MFSVIVRLLVLTVFFGMFTPQIGWAQNQDLSVLRSEVDRLFRKGRYSEASAVAKRYVDQAKQKHGSDHLEFAHAISWLAYSLQAEGHYSDAESLYKSGLAIYKKVLGEDHPDVGTSLNNVAGLYENQGRYAEAEPLYKRSLAIREKVFGKNHLTVAGSLNNLAGLYMAQGRHGEAEPLNKRSLAIREKALGKSHPHVGQSLTNLAEVYRAQSRFDEAEPLLKRSLAIGEAALGKDHPEVAISLNNLAGLYENQGRYSQAEPLLNRSIEIKEKTFGKDHPEVAIPLNNLAGLYQSQGRFDDAEPLLKRSLAIREIAFGKDHRSVGTLLNNLALFYSIQGRLSEAEPLYKRSLEIGEKTLGRNHSRVGFTLGGLALLYKEQGRLSEAEPLFERSLAIVEAAFGKDHPDVATSLNNFAGLYMSQGRWNEAEPHYRRSLAIWEMVLGKDHPNVAASLSNLAGLYERQGRFDDAEPLLKRGLAIREAALGRDHPDVATSLNSLAGLHYVQSNWKHATEYFRRGTAIVAQRTRSATQISGRRGLTGKKKTEAAQSSIFFRQLVKSAFRLTQRNDKGSAKIAPEMFQVAQWAAVSGAASSLAKMAARQSTGDLKLARLVRERQNLVDEWQKRDAARVAAVAQPPSKRKTQAETKNAARLAAIDNRVAEIQERLAADFPEYSALANPEPSSVADAQKQLKPNEALVLFLETAERKPTLEETFIWVVTKTASRWVRSDVGPNALRDQVDALRCGLDAEGAWKGSRCFDLLGVVHDQWSGKPLPFQLSRAHKLYKSLFDEVEDLIKGKDLLIVPSGPLTQLPFQVLVTKEPEKDELTREIFTKASWLAKHHAIAVLPSVSSLKALRAHAKNSKATKPFVGFGNPLLDGDAEAAKIARSIQGCAAWSLTRTARYRKVRSAVMPMPLEKSVADLEALRAATALPETADELCAVARNAGARNEDVLIGKRATETSIKALSDAGTLAKFKVLHFATHGALAGEMTGSNEPGLILSPPASATERDDGYLSATEVAGLKIDADWVILSACNTAGGESKSAEALSGLAKAFFYAGARSLLVSHWYVDSQATVALITKAFDALKRDAKIGRAGALRKAMLSLINDGNRTWHPAYWAPFVVVGEGAGSEPTNRPGKAFE